MGIDFGEYAADRIVRMTDDELTEKGRALYAEFQRTSRWTPENERMIKAWGLVCVEAGMRGLGESITELEADGAEAAPGGAG